MAALPLPGEDTEAQDLSHPFKATALTEGQGQNHQHWLKMPKPTESEKEMCNRVNVVFKDAEGILKDLQSYRGAGREILGEGIQHPADEKLQEKAWGAVVPLVGKLKKFLEFSQRLEAAFRGLLGALTSTPYSPCPASRARAGSCHTPPA